MSTRLVSFKILEEQYKVLKIKSIEEGKTLNDLFVSAIELVYFTPLEPKKSVKTKAVSKNISETNKNTENGKVS